MYYILLYVMIQVHITWFNLILQPTFHKLIVPLFYPPVSSFQCCCYRTKVCLIVVQRRDMTSGAGIRLGRNV